MIGTILGVLGIILTIGFGIYSIIVYKKTKKNVSLHFENKECYSLFRSDVKRLNIELKYDNKPITSTLILLKARLINNGQVDIDKNRIYSPLKIISSNKFKWLESTITSSPNGATSKIDINKDNQLKLKWDLLKKNEFIEIEALAEANVNNKPEGENAIEFYNNLNFDFRITDLNKINKEKEIPHIVKRGNKITKMTRTMGILTIIIGLVFLFFDFYPKYSPLPEKHNINLLLSGTKSDKVGFLESTSENKIVINTKDSKDKVEISVNEFNRKYKIKQIEFTSVNEEYLLLNRILSLVYILIGILLLVTRHLLKRLMKKRNLI